MKIKKLLSLFLCTVMLVTVMSACGGNSQAQQASETPIEATSATNVNDQLDKIDITTGGYQVNTTLDQSKVITLDIVGPGLFEHGEKGETDLVSGIFIPGWDIIEARWNELYPNIKLNFNICPWGDWQSSITTACLDGQADIIMHGASLPDLTEDLTPYIEADEGYRDQIYVTAARRTTQNPSVYKTSGISVYTAPVIVWLDTEKFEHFGVALPNDDWTIEEFMETAEKLTGTDPVTGEASYGLMLPFSGTSNLFFNYMLFAYGTGAQVFHYGETFADCTVDFTSPESVEAFDIVAKLAQFESPDVREGVSVNSVIDGSNTWAMMGSNAGVANLFQMQAAGIEEGRYIAYNLPVISKGQYAGNPMPYFGDINIAMYNQSDSKEWAWEFIKFLTTDEVATQWVADQLVYPNNVDAIEAVEAFMDERTLSVFAHAMSTMPENFNGSTNDNFNNVSFGSVTTNLLTAVDDVVNGRITPEKAAQNMQDYIDEYLSMN